MKHFLIFLFLFLLDHSLKLYSEKKLKWNKKKSFLHNFIQIIYVENHGIAFNLLENKKTLINLTNFFLLSYVLYLYFFVGAYKFSLMLIFCGGLGNLSDRLIRGYVVDYFYFNIKKFPVFNFSDFYIIIGAVSFAL